MNKNLATVLSVLFVVGMIIGIVLIVDKPVTVVSYEKIVICNDGICEISVTRHYSNGAASGTNSTIPEELYDGTQEIQSCENGYLVTKTIKYESGLQVAAASSISSERTCP